MSDDSPADEVQGDLRDHLPQFSLEQRRDDPPDGDDGFLRIVRRRLITRSADGRASEAFDYDEVQRRAIDAVAIIAHFRSQGSVWVYLRSALRPPVRFRDARRSAVEEPGTGALWELPAGMVEPDELGVDGVLSAARRELEEELGFRVPAERIRPLGPPTFPCPGIISERLFFTQVAVHPGERGAPALDGSELERCGTIAALPLTRALALSGTGEIEDAKTEIGLRRLADELARDPGVPRGTG